MSPVAVTGSSCSSLLKYPRRFHIVDTTATLAVWTRRVWISVRKRPGRPADSRQAFSPARPGQGETDQGFSGQALKKPAGFREPAGAGRHLVYFL